MNRKTHSAQGVTVKYCDTLIPEHTYLFMLLGHWPQHLQVELVGCMLQESAPPWSTEATTRERW